jgi:hypothetical protein
MITPVTLQYMSSTISLSGGRADSIDYSVTIDVFWNEGISMKGNDRFHNLGADAEVSLLFEDETEVPIIEPGKVRILLIETGDYYEILDVKPPARDLGLERTYAPMIVKKRVDL